MVLKEGGPCIALKKVKDTEGNPTTRVCNKTEAHLWYGGNTTCKGCYEKANRLGKRKMETALGTAVAVDMEDLQEENKGGVGQDRGHLRRPVRTELERETRSPSRSTPPRSCATPRPP